MALRTYRVLANDTNPQPVFNSRGGRSYSVVQGAVLDLPTDDAHLGHGYVTVALSGTTAQRPKSGDPDVPNLRAGALFVDTTLGKVIVWTGANWRDPITATVV
jgi:hypothetical protein